MRELAGITQAELAAAIGTHHSHLSRVERGLGQLPPRRMVLLAQRLGVDLDDISYLDTADRAAAAAEVA